MPDEKLLFVITLNDLPFTSMISITTGDISFKEENETVVSGKGDWDMPKTLVHRFHNQIVEKDL